MKKLQTFKFQLRLSGAEVRASYRIAGSCRFVYNKALALQKDSRIFLPKLGWVRYRNSREVVGEIHIASYQRIVNKKKKFSQNWKKAINKVSKLHQKISRIRQDYLHQTSHAISKNHALVCIEDLQIRNMSKSASGTKAIPGKNVKAKSALNRAILDQGWYELRRQLEYKATWQGGIVMAVPPKNTSRTCPRCASVSADNRQTQANFCCIVCGYENNADIVGAINILRAGHAQIACGEMVHLGHSMKQEPAEVAQALLA